MIKNQNQIIEKFDKLERDNQQLELDKKELEVKTIQFENYIKELAIEAITKRYKDLNAIKEMHMLNRDKEEQFIQDREQEIEDLSDKLNNIIEYHA